MSWGGTRDFRIRSPSFCAIPRSRTWRLDLNDDKQYIHVLLPRQTLMPRTQTVQKRMLPTPGDANTVQYFRGLLNQEVGIEQGSCMATTATYPQVRRLTKLKSTGLDASNRPQSPKTRKPSSFPVHSSIQHINIRVKANPKINGQYTAPDLTNDICCKQVLVSRTPYPNPKLKPYRVL